MIKKFFLFVFYFSQILAVSYAQTNTETEGQIEKYFVQFSPNSKTSVSMKITPMEINYSIQILNEGIKYGKIFVDDDGLFMNPVRSITIDDFDLNGDLDFVIESLGGGMGTFSVSRVFVYSREKMDFVELFSACGEGFIELRVEKEKKQLLSMYYTDFNVTKTCVTKLKKMK